MSDIRELLYPDDPYQPRDAYVSARSAMKKALPKRFYTAVAVEPVDGTYAVTLDGKRVRTPGGQPLLLASQAAADCVAAEWAAQGEHIVPLDMHATRMANVGIDRVGDVRDEVIDDIVTYAGSDLVCYRAEAPEGLVAREEAAWAPVLAHIRARYGARFVLAQGIGFAAQPDASLAAVRAGFARLADPVALAAAHTLVTLAGSALIVLALMDGALDAEAAFAAASVEEDWNAQLWGADDEAAFRRARRHEEFMTAAKVCAALGA